MEWRERERGERDREQEREMLSQVFSRHQRALRRCSTPAKKEPKKEMTVHCPERLEVSVGVYV